MTDFGIIGVGRIGTSLARNMSSNGIKVSLYDKSFDTSTDIKNHYPELESSSVYNDINKFISSISLPRKVLVLVGYAQVPLFFNLLVIDSSLLILLFFTYIWYNVSLIVGLNIILSYNNFFKSSIIVLAPLIIFFIYLLSLLTPLQLNTIS